MKLEIKSKAWSLGNKVDEPYFWPVDEVYYGTRGQARTRCWSEVEGIKNTYGEEIEYLNISMIRKKDSDIVIFEGKETKRYLVKLELAKKARMQKVKDSDYNYFCVQDTRTYLGNAIVCWAIDGNGYTSDPMKMHIYSKEEILKHEWRDTDLIIPYDIVKKSVKLYCESQLIPHNSKI